MRLKYLFPFLILPSLALSHPPDRPELHDWFERQHSVSGAWCCDISDGYILSDNEWRIVGEKYEVLIRGHWHQIGPNQLVDSNKGGPNPAGGAVVWYRFYTGINGPTIFCFTPGVFY